MIGVAISLGIKWVLEQPSTSLMFCHPRVASILKLSEDMAIPKIFDVRTWMGSWGGTSPKPTRLVGTAPWVEKLRRSKPKYKKDQTPI